MMKCLPMSRSVHFGELNDSFCSERQSAHIQLQLLGYADVSSICSFIIKLIVLVLTILLFNQIPVFAAVRNPRIGMDIDARLVTPELIDYLGQFGYGYIRLQVAAEDLVVESTGSHDILKQVKARCDKNGLGLYLVIDSKTLDSATLTEACGLVSMLQGDALLAVQILDDVNRRKEMSEVRYANILRTCAVALNLPDKSYLLLGGIKGADIDYLDRLARARALDRVDALTLNIFPPFNGIENPSGSRIVPSSDIPASIEFISIASKLGKQVWIGELGIANSLTGFGVDSFAQASLLPRAVLALLAEGAVRITMFTALDPPQTAESDASENDKVILNFGMIPHDLHPRPWGWAMRNLNFLIADLAPSRYSPVMSWAAEFPAKGDVIYHVWFENEDYYVLALWTEMPSTIDRRTGVIIYDADVNPKISQNLLSERPIPVDNNRALNMVVTGNIPLSNIPTLVVFERNAQQ